MREWIPISTSPKGRLAVAAVREFGPRPFGEVTLGELAAAADVTTGAIYHHFGSKIGLYSFVRDDVEQRLFDRMAGAAAVIDEADPSGAVRSALLVGFDFAVREGFLHILGTPPVGAERDRLAEEIRDMTAPAPPVLGCILAGAWRAALAAVAAGAEYEQAREALGSLEFRISS